MLLVKGIVYDHEITQHMHCVMLLCFFKKAFVLSFSFLLVGMRIPVADAIHRYKYLQNYSR